LQELELKKTIEAVGEAVGEDLAEMRNWKWSDK
jgi:hypothetical protein